MGLKNYFLKFFKLMDYLGLFFDYLNILKAFVNVYIFLIIKYFNHFRVYFMRFSPEFG